MQENGKMGKTDQICFHFCCHNGTWDVRLEEQRKEYDDHIEFLPISMTSSQDGGDQIRLLGKR